MALNRAVLGWHAKRSRGPSRTPKRSLGEETLLKLASSVRFVLVSALLLGSHAPSVPGQSAAVVTNVTFQVIEQDGVIILQYDLTGSGSPLDVFDVSVAVSTNGGGTFGMTPRLLTGDVGAGIRPGVGKRITWKVREDVKRLQADTVVFRVSAVREDIDTGKVDSLQVVRNMATAGYVFLRDGTISISRTTIALTLPIRASDGTRDIDYGFSVSPDRVLEVKRHKQGIRIQVLKKDWKGKDYKEYFYLYNAKSTTYGVAPDGQIRILGENIVCSGCDDSMTKLFELLKGVGVRVR